MNKLRPRNKICFQNNKNIHANLNIQKLKKKKWILLKKNVSKQKRQINLKNRIINKSKWKKLNSYEQKILNDRRYIRPEEKKKLFKERLFEKQQFKNFYGCIPEYQLINLFNILKNKKDNTNIINKFVILLESRLDVVIFRLQIARTIFESKQIINHNKIKVNNKIVNFQNYILKKGDIISITNFNKSENFYKNNIYNNKIIKTNYLQFNFKTKIGLFIKEPTFKDIQYPFDLDFKLIDAYFKK